MKLSVPFLPQKIYVAFLKKKLSKIQSVYYSLHTGPILDARIRFQQTHMAELNQLLSDLRPVKKYCLLNARFIHPKHYHDPVFLDQLLDQLSALHAKSNIDGFVFTDTYLLTALSLRKNPLSSHLEAVPGVNCMIDSIEKAAAYFEIIESSGFLMPQKLILDRSLNRDLSKLKSTGKQIKKRWPNLQIELLVNEGCIFHCPYKLAHDSQISFSNLDASKNLTYLTNQAMGCHTYFFNQPERFFKSPFIRPEDLSAYASLTDSIKLCGRTLGIRFLTNLIEAYLEKSYTGNLLDLMDATHWLSDQYHVDNKSLDPGFLKMVTQCTKTCANCKLCKDLLNHAVRKKKLTIKQYKDIQ